MEFQAFLREIWIVTVDLAPSLLLGLLIAGLLHEFLPKGLVRRGLSRSSLSSVLKAVAVGVPMPLCSCGVVPTTIGLRNDGASNGASTGFLISTPQTGVDSILVSASFLGWPFALFKVAAAALTGILGGAIVNATEPKPEESASSGSALLPVLEPAPARKSPIAKLGGALSYGVHDLLAGIDTWLVFGILAAALIGWLVPDGYLTELSWTQGVPGMLLVLAISIPLYVCTTSSVPVAASLIAAGMPTGTALVFLMAGPATNIATIFMIYRAFGRRILMIYLSVVTGMSILLGLLFDSLWTLGPAGRPMTHAHGGWLGPAAAMILGILLIYLIGGKIVRRLKSGNGAETEERNMDLKLKVEGMSCQHCVANVKRTLEEQVGVEEARPDLQSGDVRITGEGFDRAALVESIRKAGYKVVE